MFFVVPAKRSARRDPYAAAFRFRRGVRYLPSTQRPVVMSPRVRGDDASPLTVRSSMLRHYTPFRHHSFAHLTRFLRARNLVDLDRDFLAVERLQLRRLRVIVD